MKLEVYKDTAGEWRWRRRAANGKLIAISGEGYKHSTYAVEAAGKQFPDDELIVIRPDHD